MSKQVISISVTADPIPQTVRPISTPSGVIEQEKPQPRKLPKPVDQNLLPQSLPQEEPFGKIPLETSRPQGVNSQATDNDSGGKGYSGTEAAVYDSTVFTEDVTWRGVVLVKGFVIVSPQATLRIEPGTVVSFAGADSKNYAARLVVQGRIQATGTADRPIIISSVRSNGASVDWGGIAFVSSEKRNLIENCRIENAYTAIDARFSSITLKSVIINRSHRAILAHDAVVQITGGKFSGSDTGVEAFDSELDVRELTISNCGRGFVITRSSAGISSVKFLNNEKYGLLSENCRIKISSGEFSENGIGARLNGGEGQINSARFSRNRETALYLSGSRVRIHRSSFSENIGDAIRAEDGRAVVTGNVFDSNSGFNLNNSGSEEVSALLNWWGSVDSSFIVRKIHGAAGDAMSGRVHFHPWLKEKPLLMP